jgi:hypothetical protein
VLTGSLGNQSVSQTFTALQHAPVYVEVGMYAGVAQPVTIWMDDLAVDTQRIYCHPQ